ncbi:MAG: hypothetical protein A3I12_07315 [Gammaproteobacteria bacterium RIFCSPLOWO2_02_FULL_38_11]|nr:MAG: hypothetical protein A3I12_07315 [Gammaproteobacteria bacterium RIFCSPLOWO2_02_FULL_38_11]
MKLKPIVASMLVLVSGPVLAAASDNANTQAQLDAMKANVAKLQAIVEQNQPGGFTQDGWWNRITLSGLTYIDAIASNKTPALSSATTNRLVTNLDSFGGASGGATTISVTTANLFVDATVSDYTKAHLDFAYNSYPINQTHQYQVAQPLLNEGYVILGNFNKYPYYLMAGVENVQFGEYDVYPMVYSFTQLLSQTKANAATAGFVDCGTGFNAAIFGFQGIPGQASKVTGITPHHLNNYGAKVGLKNSYDNWGYNIDVDYLNNMADVNYVQTTGGSNLNLGGPVYQSTTVTGSLAANGYHNRVGGIAVDADLFGGPFDAKLRYVQTLERFSNLDVQYYKNSTLQTYGAEPWAAGLDLGYSFLTMQHQSRVGLSYQQSGEAAGVGAFGIPQYRYEGQYMVNISRFTDLGFDLYYDSDYAGNQLGTTAFGNHHNATTGLIRLGVKFA